MDILFLTDCMATGPEYLDESDMYPYRIKKYFEEKLGAQLNIEIISGSGETTFEALDKVEKIKILKRNYDFIIFAYGINDALPRGIKRTTRGKIIHAMYKLRFSKGFRLFARAYFLNPLEFLMQHIRKPLFYNSIDGCVDNVASILNELKNFTFRNVIYVTANPIMNYRFVKGNIYLNAYVDKLNSALKESGFEVVDVFKLFSDGNLESFLGNDKFHYSCEGHKVVADSVIQLIDKYIVEG